MRFSTYRKTLLALTGVSLAFYFGCGSGNKGGSSVSNEGGSSTGGGANGGAAGNGSGGTINFGGSSGSSTGGSSTGGGFNPDAGCATSTLKSSLIPANLLFIVDRSGSMKCNLPQDVAQETTQYCESHPATLDPNFPSKWQLTVTALESALKTLQQGGDVSAGLAVFPKDSSNCGVNTTPNVPIKKLDATWVSTISKFLDGETPGGSTPLAGADINGYAYMLSQWKNLPGNKFVVLLTDGFETCSPSSLPDLYAPKTGEVAKATSIGIHTFVIGVPGSEDGRALLSEIAFLGDTANDPQNCEHQDPPPMSPAPGDNVGNCHFDMTTSSNFSQDLQNALNKISGTVLSCELDVPKNASGGGVDPNKVNVTINGNLVQPDNQAPSPTCNPGAEGWQYNDATKSKIELCGQACTNAKKANATVQVVLGCPTGAIH